MRFFLDENIPLSVVDSIRRLGHDVEHARNTSLRGTSDDMIANHARKTKSILVTKDLEFGSLLLYPKKSHHGLIILRVPHYFTAKQIVATFENFLKKIVLGQLVNALTVLEPGRYRIRTL